MTTKYYTTFCWSSDYCNKTLTSTSSTLNRTCDDDSRYTFQGDAIFEFYNTLSNKEKEDLQSIHIVKYPQGLQGSGHISAHWKLINNKFYLVISSPLKRQQNQIDKINCSREFENNEIAIDSCYIWQAEDDVVIGSKVGNSNNFRKALGFEIIPNHDHSKDRVKGQMFLSLNEDQISDSQISCGVGRRTKNAYDYIHNEWRGQIQSFLLRDKAAPVASCNVIVYTREAYLKDPHMSEEEKARVQASCGSHYLVALLANAEGVPNARSPYRLCDSLAGGNLEASTWSIDEIREKAKESVEYANTWAVVSDSPFRT